MSEFMDRLKSVAARLDSDIDDIEQLCQWFEARDIPWDGVNEVAEFINTIMTTKSGAFIFGFLNGYEYYAEAISRDSA